MIQLSESLRAELISLRRHFHAHPELSLQELETSCYVEAYLRSIGLVPQRIGDYSLTALVECGKPGCKTVAIRAEMDAIAVEEALELPWRSQNQGVMHACGHDGILAVALMLAKVCAEHRSALAVNVKFLFQSAEENGKGTQIMLDGGAMEAPKVDYFVMFHFVSDAPSGVEVTRGVSSATIGAVSLKIHGKASHWCTQELGVDSIGAAGQVLQCIQQINQTYNTKDPFILGIGTIQGGTTKNVIAEETRMEGTLRACRKEDYFRLRQIFLDRLAEVERDWGVEIESFVESNPIPPIVNDDDMVDLGLSVGARVWGSNCRLNTTQYLSGDSASNYFDHATGIFFVFTAEKPGEENYPLHNGKFDFDESVMEKSVLFLYEYLKALPDIP